MPLQDKQAWTFDHMNKDNFAKNMNSAGPSFALVGKNNIVLGVAGVWMLENHRGLAWSLISKNIGTDFIHFHKAVSAFLDWQDVQRVEMALLTDFEQSIRWAKMLGFKAEGLMHKYFPNGADALLFART